jgi:hypothetical protein
MEIPLPNSLQYPLELQRDLQRRWQRLLQRTAAPNVRAAVALKRSVDNWSELPRDEKCDKYATGFNEQTQRRPRE